MTFASFPLCIHFTFRGGPSVACFWADLCLAPNIIPKMTSSQLRIPDIDQHRSIRISICWSASGFKLRYELRFKMDERRRGFGIIRIIYPVRGFACVPSDYSRPCKYREQVHFAFPCPETCDRFKNMDPKSQQLCFGSSLQARMQLFLSSDC